MAWQADAYSQVCANPKFLFNTVVLALADCSVFANMLDRI